jgi:hypothetical protein
MNDQPKTGPSLRKRSDLLRFFCWLFSWRVMRRALIGLAWCATVIALWYGEENWRGRRAWNQYREATEARGESLDFATYIPKPVPDDQNFAATPILKSSFVPPYNSILTNDLWFRVGESIAETKDQPGKSRRHFLDLVAWQMASAALQGGPAKPGQKFASDHTGLAARAAAAPAVLEGLEPDQAVFAELRAASTRPFSRYAVNYNLDNVWGILLPHLSRAKQLCQRLKLQACAELALGQSGPALEDVKLSLALADSFKTEPFLISILVRAACFQITLHPIWEGLAEHRWTDAQLQELQARLLAYDFLADVQMPLMMERSAGVLTADLVKRKGFDVLGIIGNDPSPLPQSDRLEFFVIGKLMPSGWYDREKVSYGALFDAQRKGVVDLEAKIISPEKVAANAAELNLLIYGAPPASARQILLRHKAIAAILLPALSKIPAKMALAQTAANQAALACALERYRLANGQFPDQLESLKPQFATRLPNDVITGKPYPYRRTNDGQFILQSVGWDEKSQGGLPAKTGFDRTLDQIQGDWVWQYPAIRP